MADIAALNNVYNHFMTTYTPKSISSRYDTHKKSELRSVYNSIVQSSKDSPLFLFDNSQETKAYAIDLKENARDLKNTISSLSTADTNDMLSKKTVASSDDTKAVASFIGNIEDEDSVPNLDIEIKQLAKEQTNMGHFLPAGDKVDLSPDTYSFDIHSKDMDYEFQFNINEGDTNKSTQEKLARLITRSNIGIKASVEEDENGNSALKLVSDDTGTRNSDVQFRVSDDKTSKTSGAVDYFGIGEVTEMPQNSLFVLNGDEHSTARNHFTIDKLYDISLIDTTEEGKSVSIGLKTDIESLTDNINNLIMGYNSFMQKAAAYIDSQPYAKALVREMGSISSLYEKEFESIGLNIQDDGTISMDRNLLQQTAEEDDAMSRFSNIKDFANNVLSKANNVSLDPMQYAQKKVVEYKNPGHNFASPYVTSNYSGMLFSSYC